MLVAQRALRLLLVTLGLWALSNACTPQSPTALPTSGIATTIPTIAVSVEAPKAGWSDTEAGVPVSSLDPSWGDRFAPVTLVVFADFQCKYCRAVAGALDKLRKIYGPQKIRIVWKNEPLPFHENAQAAAEVGQGVFVGLGDAAFWAFHDQAFQRQSELSGASLLTWAEQVGVRDMAAFRQTLESKRFSAKVAEDSALAKQLKVDGTPTIFVNGVVVNGAQPPKKFQAVIDKQLKKAEQRLADGTPKEKLYAALSKENFGVVEEEKEDRVTVHRVPLGLSPVRGSAKALVTLVVFSDFQCEYCKKLELTLAQLRETYGDQVRVGWKANPLPFHGGAVAAANLALEARRQKGDRGFWAAHDKLFELQTRLDEDGIFKVAAKELSLNVAQAAAAVSASKHEKTIDQDADLAEELAISGTPNTFVNGRRVVGSQPLDAFKTIVDEEIIKANALVGAGTPPEKVYEALTKDGKVIPAEVPEKRLVTPAAGPSPTKGPDDAKVIIQMFSDFQCPYCKKLEPVLIKLMKNYGSKVKLIWRDHPMPMHAQAPLAAEAAREAMSQKGQAGFWAMHDLLFANQNALAREDLERYATELKLDLVAFRAALDSRKHRATIIAESEAANKTDVPGTPGTLVNGYLIEGLKTYATIRRVVERALSEANAPSGTQP
jgi:protein-disulfide isomerase